MGTGTEIRMADVEQVIIIGSGPAGYTAALYTARANLSPLVIEGFLWGGLLQQTTEVENYPGFRDGIMGPELMQTMRDQAERFGARYITDNATAFEPGAAEGEPHTVRVGDDVFKARAVILAMGAEHKKLGAPGEEELANGRGVSYCATCDAAFFKERETIVVGGGDSAMEEAIFLAKFSSKVTIVHRRDEFRASQIMLDRARQTENIELLTPYVVEEFLPGEGGMLGSARLRHLETGEERELPMSGAFVAIGHEPNSELVRDMVETDVNGYVVTDGPSTRTTLPGVFAAGDLVDHTYRQAVTAAGTGCMSALDAEWYLRDNPHVETPAALEGTGDLAEAQWFSSTSAP
jgi:thioredoxin reductase (NADPH)